MSDPLSQIERYLIALDASLEKDISGRLKALDTQLFLELVCSRYLRLREQNFLHRGTSAVPVPELRSMLGDLLLPD